MRVAFVYPTKIKKDSFFGFLLPSMALERLAAAVEDVAECELFDARFENDLIGEIVRFKPDIVCVNVKTTLYSRQSYEAADSIKKMVPGAVTVLGGLHASSCPEEALGHGDFVITGEGENSLREFVLGAAKEKIGGLVYKSGGKTVINKKNDPPAVMDSLKPPARHLRKPHYVYSAAGLIKMDLLETSRGCTHYCSFCSPASVYPSKYRAHSPEYVFEEIKKLADSGVKYCMLTDDHFGGDPARVEKICDYIIESGIKIAFFCFIRPFTGNIELKKKMVKAGFVMLSYGAESPDPAQLARYNKGFGESAGFIKKTNAEWLAAGACYVGNSFVFGDADDSKDVIASLGAFARSLDPTYIEPLYSQPFPATRYRETLKERGLLLEDRGWDYFTEGRLLIRHPQLSEAELKKLRAAMWVNFFSPRKAAGVFRVPLYFYRTLKIPLRSVLKYMKACDYSVFGCILEDKFYKDLHYDMIDDYFRRAFKEFEPQELDMTENFDAFTDMLMLGPLKRLLENHDIVINVADGPKTIAASLCLKIRGGKILIARAAPGEQKSLYGHGRRFERTDFNAPLFLLKPAMAGEKNAIKNLALISLIIYNALFSNFFLKLSKALIKKLFTRLFF